jgi:hypothetical protein
MKNITYTPFRTVNSIEENGIELTYSYGPDQSRYKGILEKQRNPIPQKNLCEWL